MKIVIEGEYPQIEESFDFIKKILESANNVTTNAPAIVVEFDNGSNHIAISHT